MSRLSDYFPTPPVFASMRYSGDGGYVHLHNPSGQVVTGFGCFNFGLYAGGTANQTLLRAYGQPAALRPRLIAAVRSSDFATASERNKIFVAAANSAGTNIIVLISTMEVCDQRDHSFYFAFNAATADFIFKVDGQDADDTGAPNRVTPTTGTLATTAASEISIGQSYNATAASHGNFAQNNARIWNTGYREAYLSNWDDFFYDDGRAREIDTVGWSQFGAQPLVYHPYGDLELNLGSLGAFRRHGRVYPYL